MAYKDGQMISMTNGVLGSNNEVPSIEDADEVIVFYLGSHHSPTAREQSIDLP
ncbi:MAG: hypothetical protein IJA56_05175 [Clostridia bacterium]|nr:hypothetical protein [Clostridia bacterium]